MVRWDGRRDRAWVPGRVRQGETLEELKENVIDAYRMMLAEYEAEEERAGAQCTEVGVEV